MFLRFFTFDLLGGSPCTAYDIAVHPKLFERIQSSEIFYHFFVSIGMEGLEEKHELELDRESELF